MTNHLQKVKSMFDELVFIQYIFDYVELVIHILNELGSKLNEIFTSLCARKNLIEFDTLHDLLIDDQNCLKSNKDPTPIPSSQVAYK